VPEEWEAEMLSVAAKAIRKLSERHNLTADETTKVLDLLIREDTDSYFLFAFTLAMHTKGETSDELLGVCRSIEQITPRVHVDIPASQMIDVSGTGGDLLNTLNVSTATAFVVASHGLFVPKQAFYSVTGFSGSADLLAQFGVNVPEISKEPTRVVDLLCSTGIATYHFLLHLPETCVGMSNWIKKRQEIGLNFKTFMHLVGFAHSPFPMRSRLYGVYDPHYLTILAELFQKLGYERVLVVHGTGGLDEVSVIGSTKICEVRMGRVRTYEACTRHRYRSRLT
jgi:anthranilate phosphoribosyltransferase